MSVSMAGDAYAWRAMASPVTLQLPGLDPALGHAVALAMQKDVEQTEATLSRFRETAELVAFNRRIGEWVAASPRFYSALTAAWRAYRLTGGLFDPRVLRQLEAYGYQGARHAPEISGARHRWLERRPRQRTLRASAPLDLGGIGKGLGLRWASAIARRVTGTFLLNAGGDIVLSGAGPEGRGWTVGVEDPRDIRQLIAILLAPPACAICTSSVARHRWLHGSASVHHLIDPRTNRAGGAGLLSVTVVGRDPAWSEVWSKALFLHGAAGVAQAAKGRVALWVLDDGSLGMTEAARPLVFWRASHRGVRRGSENAAPHNKTT